MDTIKNINVEAYNYLMAIPAAHWSRHAFGSSSKSGMLLNNCCESFNNVLREARTKPILQLMEWIRRYVMGRFVAKKEGLTKIRGLIMPSVVKLIERGLEQVSKMTLRQADLFEFEVDHEEFTYVVNLESKTCNCNRWTLMGIPCWHALACMEVKRLNYEQYVHPAYHVSTFAKAYQPAFKAMPGHLMWDETPYPKPLPPSHRNLPGRPSKHKRKKADGEGAEATEKKNVKRAKKQNRCSNCGGLGHTYYTCKEPKVYTPAVKPNRRPGRPRKNGDEATVEIMNDETTSTAPTASIAPKKRPGRPRKDGSAPSSSVNQVATTATTVASSSTAAEPTTVIMSQQSITNSAPPPEES